MAFVKNWLHCVWGTKRKAPFLIAEKRPIIMNHILSNAVEKNIYIDILNGHSDHLHCIISLNPDQALSSVIKLIKGESSFWINRQKLTKCKFEWAVEYFAVSISESDLHSVRNYIKNQEDHHRIKSWNEEHNEFLKRYGFEEYSSE